MNDDSDIHVIDTEDSLTLSWNNRTIRKQRMSFLLVACWLAWSSVTLCATLAIAGALLSTKVEEHFGVVMALIWVACMWVMTIVLSRLIETRWQRESITIDRTAVTLRYTGMWARRPKVIAIDRIQSIAVGRMYRETFSAIRLFLSPAEGSSQFYIVGLWMASELQDQVVEALATFCRLHHLRIKMRPVGSKKSGNGVG